MANLERSLIGTCTMAIVMLVAFYPEELPGIPPSTVFSLMDVASYADVWNAVREVMDNCISRYLATNETMQESGGGINFLSQTGWSAIGTLHILKPFSQTFADVRNFMQEAKVLLVCSYGTQARQLTRGSTQSTCQLTASHRTTDRCSWRI